MTSNIETRDDAIRWLEERGLAGTKRDWCYGETVIAASSVVVKSGIRIYPESVCIHPHNGAWAISNFSNHPVEIVSCGSLQDATYKAAAMLSDQVSGAPRSEAPRGDV